jgi:hypothetical protein
MPELDSHRPTPSNPDPLTSRFSPWHACGTDYIFYSAGMKRAGHLQLVEVVCRLAPGDGETAAAARQWESIFGVKRVRDRRRDMLGFTNAKMEFVRGLEGKPEGLVSITIAVQGEEKLKGIMDRAREEGLREHGWVNMVGVKWYFVLAEGKSKL